MPGKQFRIGDEVTVRVSAVKPEESSIDFEIVGMKKAFQRTRKEAPKVIHASKKRSSGSGSREKSQPGPEKGPKQKQEVLRVRCEKIQRRKRKKKK